MPRTADQLRKEFEVSYPAGSYWPDSFVTYATQPVGRKTAVKLIKFRPDSNSPAETTFIQSSSGLHPLCRA
jgi:hypothetical protein